MGMYWQPCTDSAECKTDDVNLECVVREDKEGFWYVHNNIIVQKLLYGLLQN